MLCVWQFVSNLRLPRQDCYQEQEKPLAGTKCNRWNPAPAPVETHGLGSTHRNRRKQEDATLPLPPAPGPPLVPLLTERKGEIWLQHLNSDQGREVLIRKPVA